MRRLPVIVAVTILLVSTALSVSVGLLASPAPSSKPSAVAALPSGPTGSAALASPSASTGLPSPSPLELTFQGPRLVQARMRPHIILDKAQPNFLDPAGDGRVVTGQIFDASKGLLNW